MKALFEELTFPSENELISALNTISRNERTVIFLRYWDQKSTYAIAKIIQKEEVEVIELLYKAIEKIKKWLNVKRNRPNECGVPKFGFLHSDLNWEEFQRIESVKKPSNHRLDY